MSRMRPGSDKEQKKAKETGKHNWPDKKGWLDYYGKVGIFLNGGLKTLEVRKL